MILSLPCRLFLLAITTLLMFGTPKQASAVTIDFDALTAGTLVNAPISGVTFTLDNGEFASISDVASTSGANALLNAEDFSFSEPVGNLTMSFGGAVNNLSFGHIFENGDLTLEVFQGAVSSFVNVLFDGSPGDSDFVDLSGFAGVTAVTITHSFTDDYYMIDDISFDRASDIPLPAALPLLAAGLGLLCFAGRKRRVSA